MPTYLYECPVHGKFEEIHSITYKLTECPKCETEGKKTEIKRLINFASGILVEPNAQELKGKLDKEVADFKKELAKNENLRANIIGEDSYQKRAQAYEASVRTLGSVAPKSFRRNF